MNPPDNSLPAAFAEIRTRAGDVFAAELRQTSTLLLTFATNQQITQLLKGEDQVFLSQTFPRSGALSAPGWANLWDLLPERAPAIDGVAPADEHPPLQTTTELRLSTAAAGAASPPSSSPSRLFLSA